MRVCLDATAVPLRPAGAGRYVLDLAAALGRRPDVMLSVMCRRGDEARWRSGSDDNLAVGRAPAQRPLRLVWEQVRLPAILNRLPVDVHHGPHYTMPERASLPRVVTIHDLSLLEHPSWHEPAKVAFFRRAMRVASTRADAIVAVSGTTAQRLHALLSPKAPVHVVHHGVDHDRFRPLAADDAEGAVLDQAALRRIGAVDPYVAFVGTLEPRKDVPTLIRAFDRVAGSRKGLSLVLAGGRGWGIRAVEAAAEAAVHGHRVRMAGYVSEEQKAALLRGAAAVAYPSWEEGFGLPAVEAMAAGTPVVASPMPSTGGAGLEVDPTDVDAIAAALVTAAADERARADLSAAGRERAAALTWEATARAHVELWQSLGA